MSQDFKTHNQNKIGGARARRGFAFFDGFRRCSASKMPRRRTIANVPPAAVPAQASCSGSASCRARSSACAGAGGGGAASSSLDGWAFDCDYFADADPAGFCRGSQPSPTPSW